MALDDLLADGPDRQVDAGHQHHRLDAGERVAGRVGVHGGQIEPSWPVFIAWSMSSAAASRISPTTMRSGRIRSALRTRSRIVTSPAALDVRRPGLQAQHVLLVELQLGGVLDGHDPLVGRG